MDVLNEIIQNSIVGSLSKIQQSLIVLLVSAIVCILLIMLGAILVNGSHMQFTYWY